MCSFLCAFREVYGKTDDKINLYSRYEGKKREYDATGNYCDSDGVY